MTYVCSDIHGHYRAYQAMLEKINFGEQDELYVLGDVIDRGADGILILRDMMARPNVVAILGNHELAAAMCLPWILEEITEQNLNGLKAEQLAALREWLLNGGEPTLRALRQCSPAERADILDYIKEMELYAEVSAGGKEFVLTHAGLENFSPEKALEEYELLDFLFCRPDLELGYWADKYLIYGHTSTRSLRERAGLPETDTIFHYGTQIGVDCGCGFDGQLGCLRLEDMKEFYVREHA